MATKPNFLATRLAAVAKKDSEDAKDQMGTGPEETQENTDSKLHVKGNSKDSMTNAAKRRKKKNSATCPNCGKPKNLCKC